MKFCFTFVEKFSRLFLVRSMNAIQVEGEKMRSAQIFKEALVKTLQDKGIEYPEKTTIEAPKDKKHGDIACNIAMVLAKVLGKNPREIASDFQASLSTYLPFARIEIAGAGFLNCSFEPEFWWKTLKEVEGKKERFGQLVQENPRSVLVEYVSANPTGPLHIGHGRGAAVGDTLLRVLKNAGHKISSEYYINDAGNQMRKLGLSVWLRVQQLEGKEIDFPEECYQGDYIVDIAKEMLEKTPSLANLPEEEGQDVCYEYAMKSISDGIRADLNEFRVHHDRWFSEKSLLENNEVQKAFDLLKSKDLAFEQDNALWFRTTEFGDDKDRVLVKNDNALTYFASDIAYHDNKFNRGYDHLIDIWGADHHGYIPRMKAAIAALGKDAENDFSVVIIQMVNLLRNGEAVSMSTRSGQFDTLADVVKEVGVDATRFMFLYRKSDSPLDFDLELVKQRNLENPVYYVQYAHARIYGVQRRAEEANFEFMPSNDEILSYLTSEDDIELIRAIDQYEDVCLHAAKNLAPHAISYYLMELAGKIHSYYARNQVLGEDIKQSNARLYLLKNCAQVIKNGLDLLGVEAPESM